MTPPIPAWMREFRLDGYRNIYELIPDEPRVYGTESLYGDWDGELLVLAKDFACSKLVVDRMARGDFEPYRHKPGLRTNVSLARNVSPMLCSDDPLQCGVLYGSALAGLLRDDGEMSGSLPNRAAALRYGTQVLRHVLGSMPRVRVVVCMGQEAWECTSKCLDVSTRWSDTRGEGCCSVPAGKLEVIPVYHPAARVTNAKKAEPWKIVAQRLAKR